MVCLMEVRRGWGIAGRAASRYGLLAIAMVLSVAPAAMAQQNVTIAWDRNTDQYTTGYRVYYGPSPGNYIGNVDVGNAVTYRAAVPAGTTYYVVVRAYNSGGQLGPPSNEIATAVSGGPVNCVVSAWAFQSATAWGACTNGQRSRTETWARTIVTPPANGGAACPALTQTRTATQACSTSQPRPTATLTAALPRNSNTATLTWQTANATSVRINGVAVAASGTGQTNVTQNSTTFSLVATGPGGSMTRTATVSRVFDCVVSAWSLQGESPWGACTGGQQSRSESWVRSIITQPIGGGAACPALAETRTATQGCSSQNPALPGVPQVPRADVAGTRVTLSWSPPSTGGAPLGYGIDVGSAPGTSDIRANLNVGNVLRVAASLPRGRYYARVKAYNAVGVGPSSSDVTITVGARKRPRSPLGLSGSWNKSVAVLSWTASSEDGTGEDAPASYVIQAGTASGLANLATVRVGNTTTFQAAVPPGVYYVRVVAVNDMGVSDPSNEVVLRPVAATGRPSQLASAGEGRTVQLTWQQPSTGDAPAGYLLEAGSAPGLANLAVMRVGRQLTFTTTAPPGVYYVRVRAVDAAGVAGEASNEIVVRK